MDFLPTNPSSSNHPPNSSSTNPPPTSVALPTKQTYSNIVQNPPIAHFQHDPERAAKKSFQDDDAQFVGTFSKYKGQPGITFSEEETSMLAEHLKFALIGKFSHGLPNLKFLRQRLIKLGLRGSVSVGFINLKHVLINLSHEEDYSRLWLRGEWIFDGYPMRVFKWTPEFDPHIESPISPVWIRFPELPCHLFHKKALFGIAKLIGKPLRMDEPTADLSRPSLARVCVELDLTAPRVHEVYLGIGKKTFRQPVFFENCPPYCSTCKHLGHEHNNCLMKNKPAEPSSELTATTQNVADSDLRELIQRKKKEGKRVMFETDADNIDETGIVGTSTKSSDIDPLVAVLLEKNLEEDMTLNQKSGRDAIADLEVLNHISEVPEVIRAESENMEDGAHKLKSCLANELKAGAFNEEKDHPKETGSSCFADRLGNTQLTTPDGYPEMAHVETNRQNEADCTNPNTLVAEDQMTGADFEEKEEPTPLSNRFQSIEIIEDVELDVNEELNYNLALTSSQQVSRMPENSPHAPSHDTIPTQIPTQPCIPNISLNTTEEIETIDAATNILHQEGIQGLHRASSIIHFHDRADSEASQTATQDLQQEDIFADSAEFSKHKRNKSLEEKTISSWTQKTGGKTKKVKNINLYKAAAKRNTRSSSSSSLQF